MARNVKAYTRMRMYVHVHVCTTVQGGPPCLRVNHNLTVYLSVLLSTAQAAH